MNQQEVQAMAIANDLEPFVKVLERHGRKGLATEALDVFSKLADSFPKWDNLSKCYFRIKEYDKAIKEGETALVNAPSPQAAYVMRQNLTNIYNHNNMPEKALLYININQGIVDNADMELERSYALFLMNRKKEAQAILENQLATRSDLTEEQKTKINFNLGTYRLYEDKFQEGMRRFLLEGSKLKLWQTHSIFNRDHRLGMPLWEGTPNVNKLVVYAEAGIGDEIINVRFMRHLKERGIDAIWYEPVEELKRLNDTRVGIVELFRKNGIPVITDLSEMKSQYMWTYSMRLPIYLNLEYKDLWDGPYLKPCPDFVRKWEGLLQGKKKIAIRWRGSALYDQDLHRSYPLKQLYEALAAHDLSEVSFYSLQRDEGTEEASEFPGMTSLHDRLESLEDTMAAISLMDLVITSCTSIAHMAAAQGKEVWVLAPISAYYTWSHSGEQTPWYGENVKLFRQEQPRVWDEPISKIAQKIEAFIMP
jgi:tetratricopeptide (TPR) repeat protein